MSVVAGEFAVEALVAATGMCVGFGDVDRSRLSPARCSALSTGSAGDEDGGDPFIE